MIETLYEPGSLRPVPLLDGPLIGHMVCGRTLACFLR